MPTAVGAASAWLLARLGAAAAVVKPHSALQWWPAVACFCLPRHPEVYVELDLNLPHVPTLSCLLAQTPFAEVYVELDLTSGWVTISDNGRCAAACNASSPAAAARAAATCEAAVHQLTPFCLSPACCSGIPTDIHPATGKSALETVLTVGGHFTHVQSV